MNTLPQLLAETATRFGQRIALIEPAEGDALATLTYQELQKRVEDFAGYLQQVPVTRGERIMIWSASRTDWLVAYFGALQVGLVVVPLDINTKDDFFERLVEITEAHYLVTTQKLYSGLKKAPSLLFIDIDTLPTGTLDPTSLPTIETDELAELRLYLRDNRTTKRGYAFAS